MSTRLTFIAIFTIVTGLLALAGFAQILLTAITLIGIAAMIDILRRHKSVELRDDVLIIDQGFKELRSVYLHQVIGWKEQSYFIRGQNRRSLILFLENDERMIISDYDDVREFDTLYAYLKARFGEPPK